MFLCRHPDIGELWLIDTPGFSDSFRSDAQTLDVLANWLRAAYLEDLRLTGVIYLHSIKERRLKHSASRALSLFKDLTGEDTLNRVFLVTTFWDTIRSNEREGAENREGELHGTDEAWGRFISHGAQTKRHDGSRGSAHRLIEAVIRNQNRPLNDRGVYPLLSRELARGATLGDTSAGRNVTEAMKEAEATWEKELADLRRELKETLDKQDREYGKRLAELEQRDRTRREEMQKDKDLLHASRAEIDERLRRLEARDRTQAQAQAAADARRLKDEWDAELAREGELNSELRRREREKEFRRQRRQQEQDLWYPRCVHM